MSTQQHLERGPMPVVMIVGAGIGGLMLAMLLEKLDISYRVFERASEVRPLGSAIMLDATILPVFEQLGLLEDIQKIALPCHKAEFYNDRMKRLGDIDFTGHEKLLGYANYIVTRTSLYQLLLQHIPTHNVSVNMNVIRTEDHEGRVQIYCSDNTRYEADILVGADGVFSTVRQSLHNQLEEKGLLPRVDIDNLEVGYVNVMGVTTPKDPEKFHQLKDKYAHMTSALDTRGERAWSTVTVSNNQICWHLMARLPAADTKAQQLHNPEWEPDSVEVVCRDFEDSSCPLGGTMSEIMDDTPKLQISK
ncbi:hypothetical protein BGZ65_008138, partial [Modicella reniformis]